MCPGYLSCKSSQKITLYKMVDLKNIPKPVFRTAQLEDNIQALNYIDVDKDNREPIGIGIHGRWSWYIFAIICDVYLCTNLHIL